MHRIPWTQNELQSLIPKLKDKLKTFEDQMSEEVKAIPPLTKEECLDYLFRLGDIAMERVLTEREVSLHGQLLAQFEQAVTAEVLGKKGRYYCISESKIMELASVK